MVDFITFSLESKTNHNALAFQAPPLGTVLAVKLNEILAQDWEADGPQNVAQLVTGDRTITILVKLFECLQDCGIFHGFNTVAIEPKGKPRHICKICKI